MKKTFLAAIVAIACLFGASQLAFAHAVLVASMPAANSTMRGPGVAIDLKFNSRVDGTRSRLILVMPNGASQGLTLLKQDAPEELKARAELGPGSYTIRWQAVAADGHISRGEIPFTIK